MKIVQLKASLSDLSKKLVGKLIRILLEFLEQMWNQKGNKYPLVVYLLSKRWRSELKINLSLLKQSSLQFRNNFIYRNLAKPLTFDNEILSNYYLIFRCDCLNRIGGEFYLRFLPLYLQRKYAFSK